MSVSNVAKSAKLRIGLLIFFSLMFIFSLCMLIYQSAQYKQSREDNDDAREVAGIPDLSGLENLTPFIDMTLGDDETDEPGDDTSDIENDTSGTDESAEPGDTASGNTSDTTKAPTKVKRPNSGKDPYAKALSEADLGALQKVNKDVVGWIYISGTDISYPLLHPSVNNDQYLRSSWKSADTYSRAGTIFIETLNSPDLSDFNTIIYGHRMRDQTMFGKLGNFSKKKYWQAHPSVYILTEDGVSRYDIYAAYEVSTDGKTYQISFANDNAKQAYIDFSLEKSVINTGIKPTVDDHIITLSTCTGNGYTTRWIVQAVKAD